MVGYLQPLDEKFPIVGPDGKPTLYFIRWAQQKQIDIGEAASASTVQDLINLFMEEHKLQAGSGITLTPDGNISNSPEISANVQEILDQLATTQGSILFRGASGWEALSPGTSGQVLGTRGASVNPEWVDQTGGGGGGGYPAPSSATAWRLRFPSKLGTADSNWGGVNIGYQEVVFLAADDTPLAIGGLPNSSRDLDGTRAAAKAFDGDLVSNTSSWFPSTWANQKNDWIAYMKLLPWKPAKLKVYPPVGFVSSFPTVIRLQYSADDGTNWYDYGPPLYTRPPANGIAQTFDVDGTGIPDGVVFKPIQPAKAWRIFYPLGSRNWGGGYMGFCEVQFKDASDTILSTGGTPGSSRDVNSEWPAAEAFDGITNAAENGWLCSTFSSVNEDWLSYTKISNWMPTKVTVFPTVSQWGSFSKDFEVQFYDETDSTWYSVNKLFTTSAATAGVGQTFSLIP